MAISHNAFRNLLPSRQGLHSRSGRTSYHQISWSVEAARLVVIMIVSLWNFKNISASLPPRGLSNVRAIGKSKLESRGLETSRALAASVRLANRGSIYAKRCGDTRSRREHRQFVLSFSCKQNLYCRNKKNCIHWRVCTFFCRSSQAGK